MARKYLNNYTTLLTAAASDTDTSITVGTPPAALTPGDTYRLQISTVGGGGILLAQEFVDVTAISGNDLTVTRGVEGSASQAWSIGARVELVETAESFEVIGSSGTVTSVAVSAPTGFDVSGSPITTSGTISLTYTAGYSLPTDSSQTNWNTAYGWGDHALAGYQDELVSGTNIKTINGNSILGSGDLVVSGSAGALNDLTDVVITTPADGEALIYNSTSGDWENQALAGGGTVTSVAMTVPTGLVVSGSPITNSGTLAVAFDTGYSLVSGTDRTTWNTAIQPTGDTITDVTITEYAETTATAASGTILRADGGVQEYTMTANTTFSFDLTDGQSLTLHLSSGDTYTPTFPTMTWVGGVPTLAANSVLEFWQIGSTLFGIWVEDY